MKQLFYLLILMMLTSCASLVYHKQDGFNGNVKLTTYTSKDTSCIADHVRINYSSNMFGVKIPFEYISSNDTINTTIYNQGASLYRGIDHHNRIFYVTFANILERRNGIILALQFELRTIVVGFKCDEY